MFKTELLKETCLVFGSFGFWKFGFVSDLFYNVILAVDYPNLLDQYWAGI